MEKKTKGAALTVDATVIPHGKNAGGEDTAKEQGIPKYDAGYKQELGKKEQFIHFMKKYVGADWCQKLVPEQVELCDKEYVLEDYQKRIADLVYRMRLDDTEFYVYLIMELQSSVDFTMPFRLLTLIFALLLKIFLGTPENEREQKGFRLPVVLPVLFYNGESQWSAETEFRKYLEGSSYFGRYALNFKYYLVDLSQIETEEILSTNMLIDNILAVDKNRRNKDLGDMFGEIIERIEALNRDEQVSFQKWLEYVLMAATGEENREAVRKLIGLFRNGKGDAKMIHGLQVIIRDEYMRGIEEGESKGREVGRSEGELRKLVEQVCKKLRKQKTVKEIADELEEEAGTVVPICEAAESYAPEYPSDKVFEALTGSGMRSQCESRNREKGEK